MQWADKTWVDTGEESRSILHQTWVKIVGWTFAFIDYYDKESGKNEGRCYL